MTKVKHLQLLRTSALLTFLAFIFIPAGSIILAETQEEFAKRVNLRNFKGWKGIVFNCIHNDVAGELGPEICGKAETTFQLLAAGSGIPNVIAKRNDYFDAAYKSGLNGYVQLATQVRLTDENNHGNAAFYVEIVYEVYLSGAVEKDAAPTEVDSMQRWGDLELWSNDFVGMGSYPDVMPTITNALDSILRQALVVYLENNRN